MVDKGVVKEEYSIIILGQFSRVIHENKCCGYSLEAPQLSASNEYPQLTFLGEIKKKLSLNYHQLLLNMSSVYHTW